MLKALKIPHCKLGTFNIAKVLTGSKWYGHDGEQNYRTEKEGYDLLFEKGVSKVRSCLLITSAPKCFFLDSLSDGDLAVSKLEERIKSFGN